MATPTKKKNNKRESACNAAQRGPLLMLDREEVLAKRRRYWLLRRTQDVLLSSLAIVVLCIPMLAVAAIIYADDPHASPIFSQIRVGRDGKLFKIHKFRSMCKDAEERLSDLLGQNEMDGPAFKMKDDPRITKVGRLIRKTCIDELPQLFNVLRGEMSIVGPRPALPREAALYDGTRGRGSTSPPALHATGRCSPAGTRPRSTSGWTWT